jgi:hypothetical protein
LIVRDQELRFTVHDSLDYHQLKVSVFNDDKKTDLIGETWVPLDKVVVPGGGTSDIWHSLNCKGRYAGEIRIELTYYDTRPKEERVQEVTDVSHPTENTERSSDRLGGPRQSQPKAVKRRPLPADPTVVDHSPIRPSMQDHTQSSPLPYTPPRQFYNQPGTSTAPHSAHTSVSHPGQSALQPSSTGYGTPPSVQYHPRYSSALAEEPIYATRNPELSSVPQYPEYDSIRKSEQPSLPQDRQQYPTYDATRKSEHPSLPQERQQHPTYDDQHIHDQYPEPHRASNARSQAPYPEEFERFQSHTNQTQYATQELELPQLPPYNPRSARPATQSSQMQYMQVGSQSSPMPSYSQQPLPDGIEEPRYQPDPSRYAVPSSVSRDIYQESPLQPRSMGNRHSIQYAPYHPSVEDEHEDDTPPPPPPAHRSTGVSPMASQGEITRWNQYPSVAVPAPLNVKRSRGELAVSPLSQNYQELPGDGYDLSTSPPSAISPSTMAPIPVYKNSNIPDRQQPQETQLSTYKDYNSPHRQQSQDSQLSTYRNYNTPDRQQSQESQHGRSSDRYSLVTPPTLVAGYDPAVAAAKSQRLWEERHGHSSSLPSNVMPQYNQEFVHGNRRNSQIVPYNTIPPSSHVDNFQDGEVHRHSVPIVKPKAMTPNPRVPMRKSVSPHPDPRTPMRKSVSPHPESVPREGSLIDAFSPDSYEILNPNLKAASSINSSGPKYNTPEQAREAFREKEKEKKLEEGPIIGADGKEIDPSDHLPTETWAPEPERKTPRRGPEITLRFRQSPQGAQPMPVSAPRLPRETVIRPHSIATTVHSYSMDSVSPTAGMRNRLQKKPRGSVPHANSSPTLPVSNGNSPSYPLRERVNYGLDGSPGYPSRSSPLAAPPVPAKVPIASGQEDWERNGLAEEMRRIDIGVGNGSGGRVRRSRYGP